jgi:catechol-2,3-dioxygenase
METVIARLVKQFERGTLSRRALIQGLAALATAGAASRVEAQGVTVPFASMGIDHISVQVADLQRSVRFYETIFGLRVLNQDEPNRIVRMGRDRVIVSLHEKAPTGIVDHYAIAIAGFNRDAVTTALAAQGLTAEENLDYGFYVRDPEGIPVQMVGARA